MTTGEKIQLLRKEKGMSQEHLAEVLGVSRQALSKWELGDSNPDLDKILALSDFFRVSTDYLLKNEIQTEKAQQKSSQRIPVIIATALIAIGMMLAWALASDGTSPMDWSIARAIPGMMVQVAGIAMFEILFFSKQLEVRYQYLFWAVNAWLLTFIPSIILVAAYFNYRYGSYNFLHYTMAVVGVYIAVNAAATIYCLYRRGRSL